MASSTSSKSTNDFPSEVAQPAVRALASIGVTRLEQVTRFSEAELLALHGMGPKALTAIKAALRARGMSLARRSRGTEVKP